MAINEKESILVTIDCASIELIGVPTNNMENTAKVQSAKATAIGTVKNSKTNSEPKSIPIII
jgi:hypothetical protein